MANYRRVKITNANNYEVNSNGDVFNKHGTKLSKRKDGRHAIVNDDGETKYITASAEFILATYIPGKTPGRYSMGIDFPMYEVDNNANIFNIHRPETPLTTDEYEGVRLINEFGITVRMNRFRALAKYALGHKDPSPEYVQFLKRQFEDDEVTLNDIKYRTKGFYENVNPVVPVVPLEKPSSAEWVTWHKPRPVNYGNWVIEDGFENDGEAFTIAFTDPETDETVVLSID